jgi:transcriptional regulator with XRE-family HTH domain
METRRSLRYREPHEHRTALPVGTLLRDWRLRRRLSQLDLAGEAEISTRHLSFVETGRAAPSREMVLRLANRLDVPLRERNALLVAAGFAPMYGERGSTSRRWPRAPGDRSGAEGPRALPGARRRSPLDARLVQPRGAAADGGRGAGLLQPPVNVLRLSLHPDGLAPRIVNLAAWRAHVLERLRQQVVASGDDELARSPTSCALPRPER